MSYSASTAMLNYRGAKTFMKTVSGTKYTIEGYVDLPLTSRSGRGEVPLLLLDVAHVPWTRSTIEGGRGCNKFVLDLGGDGTKRSPTGDMFDQPPGEMS